jgi:hypothetical protein
MCFTLILRILILCYYGKRAIGIQHNIIIIVSSKLVFIINLKSRYGDINSCASGSSVSCWGSTSTDMYSISSKYRMKFPSGK